MNDNSFNYTLALIPNSKLAGLFFPDVALFGNSVRQTVPIKGYSLGLQQISVKLICDCV